MKLYVSLVGLCAALAPALPSQAQTTPAEPSAATSAQPLTPRKTLFKLGTGLHRTFTGFRGVRMPVTLGVERQLNAKFSVYGNLVANLDLRERSIYQYYLVSAGTAVTYRPPLVDRYIIEAGGRYYYNQAARVQHNRSAGPFAGNFLALQANADFGPRYSGENPRHVQYYFPGLSAQWGMQRRLGTIALFDFSVGPGLYMQKSRRVVYEGTAYRFETYRRAEVGIELNLRLSLVR